MTKMIKLAAFIGVFTLASVSVAEAATPSFYLGGQLGRSSMGYDNKDFSVVEPAAYSASPVVPASGTVDKRGVGGRVFLGYQFNPNWAVELGYTRFANTEAKNLDLTGLLDAYSTNGKGEIDQDAIDLVGKAILPVSDTGNIYAKAGIANVKAEKHITATGYNISGASTGETYKTSSSTHKVRPTFAVGGSLDLNPQVPVFLEWSRITSGGGIDNSDLISVGIAYHFI